MGFFYNFEMKMDASFFLYGIRQPKELPGSCRSERALDEAYEFFPVVLSDVLINTHILI